jgi:3-hydroxyisobutyrate dehydrogenase-like beta-hydroxyacid dehydrogenase
MAVGVIGAGAMGLGIVASLLRGGYRVHVRDIRREAEDAAAALGARCEPTPDAVVRACPITLVVVVDSAQIEDVLFGPAGAAAALAPGSLVLIASTVAPGDVEAFATRVANTPGELLDTPISGGPQRAHAGTMTMMVAGRAAALDRCDPVFAAIAGKVFRVGNRAGDGARYKVINNLLAAVNLAAGAEALALAAKAGLDPAQVLDVINASSGASWILADRMPRALAGDYAPRAATRVLCKDAGLAVGFAAQHGVAAPFARAAQEAFAAAVAAGYGEDDDASLYAFCRRAMGL